MSAPSRASSPSKPAARKGRIRSTRPTSPVPVDTFPDRFFRHLVLNLRNGVLAIARDGRVAAMNDVAYRVLGLTRQADDLGQPFGEVLKGYPEIVRVLQSAFETSDLPNRAELRLPATGRAIGYTISKIYDDERQEIGLTLFFKDLTRVEQIEERERLRDRLAKLGEMAAAIAHEVKNPLASIEVMAGVLRRQLTDHADAQEALSDIIKESRMANAIVVEVLEFVRPIRLQVELLNVEQVARDAIAGLERGQEQIRLSVDPDVPELMADPNQLRQLLTNLMTNAVEALDTDSPDVMPRTTQGHVSVDIVHVPHDAEPGSTEASLPARVRIEVRDNGPGISEDDLERIFSPFFTTKPQGTGLGLSIVRKVVDAHDGIIDAMSAPDRGTTFRVTLPILPAPEYVLESTHGTHTRR